MDLRTRAAQPLVDTLSTRALSLCRLPFFLWRLPDLLVQRVTVGMALPIPPRTGCKKSLGLDISRCLFGFFLVLVFNWFQM